MKAQHGHETKVLIKLECISQLLHILRENFQAVDTSSPGSTKACICTHRPRLARKGQNRECSRKWSLQVSPGLQQLQLIVVDGYATCGHY